MSIGNPSLQPCSVLAVAPIRRARRIHRPTRTWTPGTSAPARQTSAGVQSTMGVPPNSIDNASSS
jgi:hypothetical protein